MAHRWQYKYDITSTSFVKSGTTFEKSGTSFPKKWYKVLEKWYKFLEKWYKFLEKWYKFCKSCSTFHRSGKRFGNSCTTLTKLVPIIWYLYYHLWAMAWPTGDTSFSQSRVNEKTVDACHLRATGRKPLLDPARKFAAWTLDQKSGSTCRHQSFTLPISGKVESGRIQG